MTEQKSEASYGVMFSHEGKNWIFDPDVARPLTPREAVLITVAFQSMSAQNVPPGWPTEFLTHHDLWRHFRQEAPGA